MGAVESVMTEHKMREFVTFGMTGSHRRWCECGEPWSVDENRCGRPERRRLAWGPFGVGVVVTLLSVLVQLLLISPSLPPIWEIVLWVAACAVDVVLFASAIAALVGGKRRST